MPLCALGSLLFSATQEIDFSPLSKRNPQEPAARARRVSNYGKLPLRLEANAGQTDERVKFVSRGRGYTMFLTRDEAVLSLRSQDSGVRSQNGRLQPEIGNWKLETGKSKLEDRNSKFEKRNSKIENRGRGFHDLESGIFNLPSLFPRPEVLIQNPKSEIRNFPTPNPEFPTPTVLRMKLAGANVKAKVVGLDELPGKSNYFIGNDPKKWRINVTNYARVKYESVYPGIDLVYYGNEGGQLEHDFVVAPGADPNNIRFEIVGAGLALPSGARQAAPLRIDPAGDLVIPTDAGEVRFHKPVVYPPVAPSVAWLYEPRPFGGHRLPLQPAPKSKIENRKLLDGRFVLLAENCVGFEIADYDKSRPLVIDPVLIYSTYLGGADDDYAVGIAVDSSGSAYVTGQTYSADFPTYSPIQDRYADQIDAFVAKLSPSGDALVYSTYLGGSNSDSAGAVAVDSSGNAYVTGATSSTDFPTVNPIQAIFGGNNDVFVAKLNAAGNALVYSTFLGGSSDNLRSGYDAGYGIALDTSGNAYVTGPTASTDFPTVNPIQATLAGGSSDAFISKLNAAGSELVYSTFLGGASNEYGRGIAVTSTGNVYVTGYTDSTNFPTANPIQATYGGRNDVFVAELNAGGSALLYSTYLGGADNDSAIGIAIDSSGNAFVTGITYSTDFPTWNPLQASNAGGQDAFVAKVNAAGDALLFSTYLGGTFNDYGAGIAVDTSGNAYITGYTNSTDFPTQNPLQENKAGAQDVFLVKLDPEGSALLQSTYFGGIFADYGQGIAVDGMGFVYLTGSTSSPNFPTLNPMQPVSTNSSYNYDAYVAKLALVHVPGLELSPAQLDFGGQLAGTISTAQTMTITNIGDLPLIVSGIAASGDFDVPAVSFPCSIGAALEPGLSCGMSVTYAPTATGTRTGTLTIVSNAPASPFNARLSGTGADFAVVAQSGQATSATVNAGATATYNLQIAPTGFVGDVTLGCAFQDSTPQGVSCSVSPAAVTLNGTDPAPFKVNVSTTARALAVPQDGDYKSPLQTRPWARHIVPLLLGLMLLAAVAGLYEPRSWFTGHRPALQPCSFVCLSLRQGNFRPALQWAPLVATLFIVLLWAACGGGGSSTTPQTGTPAGNYTLTLTATAGGVSKTTNLSLRVN